MSFRKNPGMAFWAVVLLSTFALAATDARADGLIDDLPEDGAWVQFDKDWETFDEQGEVQTKGIGSVTLSSVGRETVEGEECRWIELFRAKKPLREELKKVIASPGERGT